MSVKICLFAGSHANTNKVKSWFIMKYKSIVKNVNKMFIPTAGSIRSSYLQ
jgi:hypothetical protein